MKKEFKSEQRVFNMMAGNPNFSRADIRTVFYLFEKLVILKKGFVEPITRMNEQTFWLTKEKVTEKMQKINDFFRSKGIEETIFRNLDDFYSCVEDYDYYYEFKTPTQYKEEEEKRKSSS